MSSRGSGGQAQSGMSGGEDYLIRAFGTVAKRPGLAAAGDNGPLGKRWGPLMVSPARAGRGSGGLIDLLAEFAGKLGPEFGMGFDQAYDIAKILGQRSARLIDAIVPRLVDERS